MKKERIREIEKYWEGFLKEFRERTGSIYSDRAIMFAVGTLTYGYLWFLERNKKGRKWISPFLFQRKKISDEDILNEVQKWYGPLINW